MGSYRSYTYLKDWVLGQMSKDTGSLSSFIGGTYVCKKFDKGEAQDWVLVSSHVNGSVCNPLTAAIFYTEDLDPAGAPLPFKGRWASLKGTRVQPKGTGGKGR